MDIVVAFIGYSYFVSMGILLGLVICSAFSATVAGVIRIRTWSDLLALSCLSLVPLINILTLVVIGSEILFSHPVHQWLNSPLHKDK